MATKHSLIRYNGCISLFPTPSYVLLLYADYYYDLIHQRDDMKNAIDLLRPLEKILTNNSSLSVSSSVGLTNDFTFLNPPFSFIRFFLSPFLRSFSQLLH